MPNSGLSLSKILSGISKSFNIMQEIIPLYQKISPGINNVYKIIDKFKKNKITQNKKTITLESNSNNPSFFI